MALSKVKYTAHTLILEFYLRKSGKTVVSIYRERENVFIAEETGAFLHKYLAGAFYNISRHLG